MSSFAPTGEGFEACSTVLSAFGRQYVRRGVRLAVEEAFAERHQAEPPRSFVLGETGLQSGGKLWPHASHEHGLSVDIFLPLVDGESAPVELSHQFWNLWGYCRHFDEAGQYRGTEWEAAPRVVPILGRISPCFSWRSQSLVRVDFAETARLLGALRRHARAHGLLVRSVILAPEYIPLLLASTGASELGDVQTKLVRKPVWIRHDEHVHIEFVFSSR